jgi:hypothetical protein
VLEKSAALQLRDDERNEILIAPRHARRADNEAVTGGRGEPFFERVGDLPWSADPGRRQLAATRDGDEIARRWLSVSQCGDDAVPPGLGAGEPGSSASVKGSSSGFDPNRSWCSDSSINE